MGRRNRCNKGIPRSVQKNRDFTVVGLKIEDGHRERRLKD